MATFDFVKNEKHKFIFCNLVSFLVLATFRIS